MFVMLWYMLVREVPHDRKERGPTSRRGGCIAGVLYHEGNFIQKTDSAMSFHHTATFFVVCRCLATKFE